MRWVVTAPGKTELHPDVLRGAAVFVEYAPQTRVEGDIQQMPSDFAVTGCGRFSLSARQAAPAPPRSPYSTLSVLLWKIFCAALHARHGPGVGNGRAHGLIPALDDPKDLFSLLRQPTLASRLQHLPEMAEA